MNKLLLTSACVAGLITCQMANAVSYSFFKITNNGNQDVSSQLSVEVTGAGSQASFQFFNNVGIASSITDIYFDDGTLLGIALITTSGAGVAFNSPANPSNLPGGNNASPAFVTTQNFSADSDPPVSQNGVNAATEWVTITFNLINGKTIVDTLAALDDGSLRIGLHVQAIGSKGGSDSYVNNGRNVPDGGVTAAMLGLGMLGLSFMSRRKA
ncbi:MAG: hypothetical protein KJZ78_24495 [Bryobacteraceae bacterium]|nr:hypothetical protein [Bryobacteraceae bacterium]